MSSRIVKDVQSRGWCLTINNPSDVFKCKLVELSEKFSVLYLSAQLEIGKLGTEHIQAYIEWKTPHRFSDVKVMFPTAHIEKRRGTPFEAFQYCLKLSGRSERYWSVQSESVPKMAYSNKLDWYQLCCQIPTLYEFKKSYEYLYIKNKKYVHSYYLDISRVPKRRDLEVIVLVGGTGIGKTSYVYDKEDDLYIKDCTQWWDGYIGQSVVLIDEYTGQWPIEYLLKILQGFRMQLQVKCDYVPALYTRLYLTSNLEVRDWYKYIDDKQLQALYRRINVIYTRDNFDNVWLEI